MKQKIKIKNNQESAVIDIEGTIGVPEEWQFDDPQQRVATYEAFRGSIAAIEELQASKVVVNIRSTGGDVGDALLIYDALVALDAEITTRCWGYVASAATVIAQAASEGQREISPNALYLIHNSTCMAEGNASELVQRAELLRKSDETLAELYARRSGLPVEGFATLMAEEAGEGRWLNAKETIEAGLADREIESVEVEKPAVERVTESLESALSSVKGLIRKIGNQLRGEAESPEEATEEETAEETSVVQPTKSTADSQATKSLIAFEEQQKMLKPTTTQPIEDPSLQESQMSANESAYQRDARRFRA